MGSKKLAGCVSLAAPSLFLSLLLFSVALDSAQCAAKITSWYVPPPLTTFYWQLDSTGPGYSVPTNKKAKVYDIDGFGAPASLIKSLQTKYGKKVICYFSFGTWENWRPDKALFPASVIGGPVCQDTDANGKCISAWPGEKWLDVTSAAVRKIMEARVKLAKKKGCDGIEPDNVDAYSNTIFQPGTKPKFTLTYNDQLNYNTWIANTVHKYNLSVGLKNAGDMVSDLVDHFDWALVESCNQYTDWTSGPWYSGKYECDPFNLFVNNSKAVFVAEYVDFWGDSSNWQGQGITFPQGLCIDNNAHGFSASEDNLDLTQTPSFPKADCLAHLKNPRFCFSRCTANCAKFSTWKKYFIKGVDMQDFDAMGQCIRACKAKSCPFTA